MVQQAGAYLMNASPSHVELIPALNSPLPSYTPGMVGAREGGIVSVTSLAQEHNATSPNKFRCNKGNMSFCLYSRVNK